MAGGGGGGGADTPPWYPLPLTPLPKEEGVEGAGEHHVSPYLSDGYPLQWWEIIDKQREFWVEDLNKSKGESQLQKVAYNK